LWIAGLAWTLDRFVRDGSSWQRLLGREAFVLESSPEYAPGAE
jgi:hypothetical protein